MRTIFGMNALTSAICLLISLVSVVLHGAQDQVVPTTPTVDKDGFIVLDTLRIEQQLRKRREVPVKQGDLQLSQIRSDYGLPRYTAHNALIDALATAELMLAIAARMEPDSHLKLAPHLSYF